MLDPITAFFVLVAGMAGLGAGLRISHKWTDDELLNELIRRGVEKKLWTDDRANLEKKISEAIELVAR